MTERIPGEASAEPKDDGSAGLIRLSEFRTLWAAYAQSVLGDQLARVALSLLVFDRTESAGWTRRPTH